MILGSLIEATLMAILFLASLFLSTTHPKLSIMLLFLTFCICSLDFINFQLLILSQFLHSFFGKDREMPD